MPQEPRPDGSPRKLPTDQTLIAFRLYCRLTFARLHQHNPRSSRSSPNRPNSVRRRREGLPPQPLGSPTETEALVRVRRVQSFFRSSVLTSCDYRCALTGPPIPALLDASHIIPWSASPHRRADPPKGQLPRRPVYFRPSLPVASALYRECANL
jgi:hypothetical protein